MLTSIPMFKFPFLEWPRGLFLCESFVTGPAGGPAGAEGGGEGGRRMSSLIKSLEIAHECIGTQYVVGGGGGGVV